MNGTVTLCSIKIPPATYRDEIAERHKILAAVPAARRPHTRELPPRGVRVLTIFDKARQINKLDPDLLIDVLLERGWLVDRDSLMGLREDEIEGENSRTVHETGTIVEIEVQASGRSPQRHGHHAPRSVRLDSGNGR